MIVFCLPGATFTIGFMESWTRLCNRMHQDGIEYEVMTGYSPDIYLCRNKLLLPDGMGAGVPWKDRVPWAGRLDYEKVVWIDSDTVFTPDQVLKLLDHDKDVVSAFIPTGPTGQSALGWYEDDRFMYIMIPHIHAGAHIGDEQFNVEGDLLEVDFAGLATVVVKAGVFESIGFPWFTSQVYKSSTGTQAITSEDIGWSLRVREHGFRMWGDTKVIMGHQKTVILQ